MKKKIDDKIKTLIENAIAMNERAMFTIVGDRGRDQVANLHYFYTKLNPGKKLNILWCYKNQLGFSSHARKKMKKIKKLQNKGLYEPNEENAFDLFISSTDIKYCFYHETQRILGNTYGILVLQDFEAITPNLLCRTIETIQGGGMVIFLFNNMASLKQLYTISMDVHDRYRTDANQDVEPRFNERFILSLSTCKNAIVMDDEMNILPISSHIKNLEPVDRNVDVTQENVFLSGREKELASLKAQMKDKAPVGNLLELCKTLDQAKCVMAMVDSISEKSMRQTVSINAGRGRGKSSAMGMAISSAVVFGFSNIFVTAPSPENLKTFFEFVVKGLITLGYREHKDFSVQEGIEEPFKNNIIKINIFRDHKQSISYILPTDVNLFQMAELLVIDEAAAIPLHVVKKIMPPCLIFMASTIHGYEGTGRSLSIKLLNQLRQQSITSVNSSQTGTNSRILKEVKLDQAIRYADNDPVEDWLNRLLILDATDIEPLNEGYPKPEDLELYHVDRDTLFSFHKGSESFLKKVMSLFVSSHYKNSPNDLQLLSDAPAHAVFVLCRSIEKKNESGKSGIPDIYAAIQVCEEGGVSKNVILNNNKRGFKPAGDLIPWTVSEHYQDNEFPHLKGIRVVRIATHPDCQRMGYGSRALHLLTEYYEGKMINLDVTTLQENTILECKSKNQNTGSDLKTEEIKPKKKLRPLLSKLADIKPPFVYYLGTAFGLTKELFNFWRRGDFYPVYLKLTENDITGEHSCIMIKPFDMKDEIQTFGIKEKTSSEYGNKVRWLNPFLSDFKKRLVSLLAYDLKSLSIKLGLSLLDPHITRTTTEEKDTMNEDEDDESNAAHSTLSKEEMDIFISKYDYRRLELYTKNLVKYQMIIDIVPYIAKFFFVNKLPTVKLAYTQAAILMGFGLQFKPFDSIAEELNLPTSQLLAMFNKMIKKFTSAIKEIYEKDILKEEEKLSKKSKHVSLKPANETDISLDLREELQSEVLNIKKNEKEQRNKYLQEKFSKLEKEGNNSGTKVLNKKRERDEN